MADESLEDILTNIENIGDSYEEDEEDSEMENLGEDTLDYVDEINTYEEFDNILSAISTQDSPQPTEDNSVSYVGAFARGIKDAFTNKIDYALSRASSQSLTTAGDRVKSGELDTEGKQILYSVGHEVENFAQNALAAVKLGSAGAGGGALTGPAAPVAVPAGAIMGASSGYAASAAYNSLVMAGEVFKDAYNDALDRGYKESDALWEAYEKSGATMGLEYISQFVPVGGKYAGKAISKLLPDLVKNGIAKVNKGFVQIIDKAAFRKVAAGASAKEAVKDTAKKSVVGTVLKEGVKGGVEEYAEESAESIAHQLFEIGNDPNKSLEDFDFKDVTQSGEGGGIAGSILRVAAPHIYKGAQRGARIPGDIKDRYKYGKKVTEEVTTIDDKTATVKAREKTIEEAKKYAEYDTAADKESVATTNIQNTIRDSEDNVVQYKDIKDDEQYTFKDKEGVEKTMSGKEAKQAWKAEYQKNKEIHKKDIVANLAGKDSFNELFSVKNSKGEDVTNNKTFNDDEEYSVSFAGKTENVFGRDIQKIKDRYLEETISAARNELGIGHLNKKSDKPVISQQMADVITRHRQQLNNIQDFYETHQVIDLDTNAAVNPNEVRPEGRYRVVRNDGTVVNEDTSGLGVSILEKYAPVKHQGWSPINISEAEANLIQRGNATVNGKYLNLSRQTDGDLIDQYTLHEQIGTSGYIGTDWGNLSNDDNRLYTIKNRNGDIVVKDYTGKQINTFLDLVTRNASMEDADFLSEHTIQTMEGEEVDWNNLDENDINTRYKILHKGNVIGENLSSSGASLYKRLAARQFIKTENGQTYIYIKASSQYDGAPGTLFVRANDPTNTTYIGDNTDLMGDTNFDFERDILSAKQKQQTRLAVLKAIKNKQDAQSKANNAELNAEEAGNLNESQKEYKSKSNDEALERQSEFSGGANPESFGQVIESEWSDDFIFSKPDTVPLSSEEVANTIQSDVDKLISIYGDDINKVIKGEDGLLISKEHIRALLSTMARNLSYKMLNDLGELGIQGAHVGEQTYGTIVPRLRYFRIRNSRDYRAGFHELAHGIFRDGLFGKGTKGIASKMSATGDATVFINEMDTLFSRKVSSKSNIDLSSYSDEAIPEEQFAEAFMVFATEPAFEADFRKYAPKTFAALDAYLTETKTWNDIKKARTVAQYYVNQTPLQRAIADLTPPTRDMFRQVFSPTWWKRVSLRRAAAYVMSYTTDDMAGVRFAIKDLGLEEGTDRLEYLRSIGNDMAHRFISGDGCNFAGQSLRGFGHVNLVELFAPLKQFGKDGENKLAAALWAQATLGEYIGNERVLTKLININNKLEKDFIRTFGIMRNISLQHWDEFIKLEDTQAGDIQNADKWNMSAQEVADLINKYKKEARNLLSSGDIARAENDKLLHKEYEAIMAEDLSLPGVDANIRKQKLAAWKEKVIKEALRQNFKQRAFKEVAATGQSLADAMKIYNEVLVEDKNASLYAQAAENFHKYQTNLLHSIAGASPEMQFYAERILNNASGWHAPLLRQFSEDENPASPHYLLANREGSDRPIQNLFDSTIKQTVAMFDAAARSAIKNYMVNLASNSGSGLYIREITEPSEHISITMKNFREAALAARDEKLQELRDRGVEITTEVASKVNAMIEEMEKLNISAFDLFTPTMKVNNDLCQFSYFDPYQNKMRFFETEKEVYQALKKPKDVSALPWLSKLGRMVTMGMKLGLITYNPAFLVFTNPVRDMITLSWKGETPLYRSGNRFLDTNPLNTVPGAIYQVLKVYSDFILNKGDPDVFKLMDHFGVGYNTRNNTYATYQKMIYSDPSVKRLSTNPLKRMLQYGDVVFERLGSLDKLARVAQLKAMLEKDGLSADNFNVNKRNVASMVLEKQVLVSNGITPEIIERHLTDKQKTIWDNTRADDVPVLDLSADQVNAIYQDIDPANLHIFTQDQRIKYAKALRLCTTDFARGGEMLRSINRVMLFAQPAYNGTAQSVERIKERIATGHGDEVFANMITTFAAGLAFQYLIPEDEDESEDEMWKGVKVSLLGHTWRLPVLAEDMVWFQAGRYLMKDSPKDFQKFISSFFSNINPFGSLSGPFGIIRSLVSGRRLNDLSDTRYGDPIVPKYMTDTMGKKYPELFYNESTSALARTIGKIIGSPMEVQYYMDQFGISIWDNIIENLLGTRRVTRTKSGIDIPNNSRRLSDMIAPFGIDTHPYKTRSQQALEDMLDDAKGEYYYNVPAEKRETPKTMNREQNKLRMNYLALKQVNQTVSMYNKLESIAQTQTDRDNIRQDKIKYMKDMVKLLEKQPGLEGKYYYKLSAQRKRMQDKLSWKERVLSKQAKTQQPSGMLKAVDTALTAVVSPSFAADEIRPGERPTQITKYNFPTQFPVTAEKESGGKMWSTKRESKKVKGHEIGGFGMYQLDPWARGGHAKMRSYIDSSKFSAELSKAYDSSSPYGIDYNKLADIWENLAKDPKTASAFSRDYEDFMIKEYLPTSLLNKFQAAGYEIDNPNVKDAIFSYSVQRPASVRAFAESLPKAEKNSISPSDSISAIIESKRNNPHLKRYSSRYDEEEQMLLENERNRR